MDDGKNSRLKASNKLETPLQGRRKVFITDQAKLNPEHII